MARKKRNFTTFNLSFLDIMSCGFGAVVLVFLIIDHSMEVQSKELNENLLSEVDLLEEDISDGEEGLVRLRNTLSDVDLEMVEAQGLATRITEEMDQYEALIEDLKRKDFIGIAQWEPRSIENPDFVRHTAQTFKSALPFVRFLCQALNLPL